MHVNLFTGRTKPVSVSRVVMCAGRPCYETKPVSVSRVVMCAGRTCYENKPVSVSRVVMCAGRTCYENISFEMQNQRYHQFLLPLNYDRKFPK